MDPGRALSGAVHSGKCVARPVYHMAGELAKSDGTPLSDRHTALPPQRKCLAMTCPEHCSFALAKLPGEGQRPSHDVNPYPPPTTQFPTPINQSKHPLYPPKPSDPRPPKVKIPPPVQQYRTFVL